MPGPPRRTGALVLWHEPAGPDRLGGQHAEQVEVGRLLVVEKAHLMTGPGGRIEYLAPVRGVEQAHRPVNFLAHGVGRWTHGRQAREFRADPRRSQPPDPRAPT